MLSKFEQVSLLESDLREDLGVDVTIILEWILKKQVLLGGIGLIRLRIGIIGKSLSIRHGIFRYHKPWSYC